MAISRYPAKVFMPRLERPFPSVLAFLCHRFPRIDRQSWERRMAQGKVLGEDGLPLGPQAPYQPERRLFYFREVEGEPVIPYQERILFQSDEILVCCKPHFLPVTPGGRYVEECLVNRLRSSTGIDHLVPLHRIDRDTAGIVLFSTNPATRGLYNRLFASGAVRKSYRALAAPTGEAPGRVWRVENRIVPGEPWFTMRMEQGEANARSHIELLRAGERCDLFELVPETGKTHQLRLHMSFLGFPILNDRLYPTLKPPRPDDFGRPLKLLAKRLEFTDPLSGKSLQFESERELLWYH